MGRINAPSAVIGTKLPATVINFCNYHLAIATIAK